MLLLVVNLRLINFYTFRQLIGQKSAEDTFAALKENVDLISFLSITLLYFSIFSLFHR